MNRRVADLPACKKCGGRFVPLALCDTCGGASVLRELRVVGDVLPCPDCGSENAAQVLCVQCHDKLPLGSFPAAKPTARRPTSCPSCATFLGPRDSKCPTCGYSFAPDVKHERLKARRTRRIRGDLDAIQTQEIQSILGLDRDQAQAFVRAGYGSVRRIARAAEADIAGIPGVGLEAAKAIVGRARALPNAQLPPGRELAHPDEEFECPLCGCVTSAFALSCRDCRAAFDEEEMDEAVRANLLRDGEQGLLAFYDLRLMDDPEDAALWYARGVHLDGMGRPQDALQSFDRAAALSPSKRKIAIARSRALARVTNEPTAAEKLRTTLKEVVDTAALEQEIASFQRSTDTTAATCPTCGAAVARGSGRCSDCGSPLSAAPAEPEVGSPEATEPDMTPLDDLFGELEKSAALRAPKVVEPPAEPREEPPAPPPEEPVQAEPPPATPPTPAEDVSHVPGPKGFRTRSLFRRGRGEKATGLTNGAVNGRGLVNGFVNGRGRTNGLVNGVGRTNGMVNGRGRTNGLVNGRGRTNGLVNGTIPRGRRGPRTPFARSRNRTTFTLLLAGIVMAGIIAGALFFPTTPAESIVIDGSLNDWASVPSLDAATAARSPDIELARYAAVLDGTRLYLFAASRGSTFGDPTGYDGIYFLIDADGNASTGFRMSDIGAEAVIETYGSSGALAGSIGFAFPPSAELNWSRRSPGPVVHAAASAAGVELRLSTYDLIGFDAASFRIAVLSDSYDGDQSRGVGLLSRSPGAIRIEVASLAAVLGTGPSALAELRIRAIGPLSDSDRWTVSSFRLNATPGLVTSLSAESVNLTRGLPTATIQVSVQAPGFLPGDAVQVGLTGATASRPVAIVGGPARAYVLSTNMTKRVDGLFADWAADAVADSDSSPVNNSDADIARAGAGAGGTSAYFFVEVRGVLLRGSLPQRLVRTASSGGGPSNATPEARRTGEDVLRAYIDVNASDPTGTPVGGLFADYLVEIRGHGGRVTSRAAFAWSSGWTRIFGSPVLVEKESVAIEGALMLPSTPSDIRMVFETTDWSGVGDFTAPIQGSVASPPAANPSILAAPGLIIYSGTNAVTVLAKALTNEPTVDGSCGTSSTEYDGADSASNANLKFFVGRRSAISYVFVCLEVTADTSDDGTSDWGELLFDQEHDASSTPQGNDRRFRVTGGDGAGTFTQNKGDGSGWVACGGSCDAGNSARGKFNNSANEVYEFKIRFSDIWGSDAPAVDERAGFAIVAFSNTGSATYPWGADNVNENNPSTWGHLDVGFPEFPEFVAVAGSVLVLGFVAIRRRLRKYI